MHWTKEEIEFLKKNYSKSRYIKEISKKLNKTIKAIHHKASREGLFRPRFPSDKPKKKNSKKNNR